MRKRNIIPRHDGFYVMPCEVVSPKPCFLHEFHITRAKDLSMPLLLKPGDQTPSSLTYLSWPTTSQARMGNRVPIDN